MTQETAQGCGCVVVALGFVVTLVALLDILAPALGTDLTGISFLASAAIWIGIFVALEKPGVIKWIGELQSEHQAKQDKLRAELKGRATVVRSYDTGFGAAEKRGRQEYEQEAAALAALGYEPVLSAASDQASWMGMKVGKLTVTYRRKEAPTDPIPMPSAARTAETTPELLSAEGTKVCPDCAEAIQLAARVCRYCRYEFGGAEDPLQVALGREWRRGMAHEEVLAVLLRRYADKKVVHGYEADTPEKGAAAAARNASNFAIRELAPVASTWEGGPGMKILWVTYLPREAKQLLALAQAGRADG